MTAYKSIAQIIHTVKAEHLTDAQTPSEQELFRKVIDFVEDIALLLPKRGVEATYRRISSALFDFRFDVLPFLSTLPEIVIEIVPKTSKSRELRQLYQLTQDIMPIYMFIFNTVLKENISPMPHQHIRLEELNSIANYVPLPVDISNLVEDSLRVEFGLIVSELIQAGELTPSPPVSVEIYSFLKNAFERYAAQTSILGIWNPETFEHSDKQLLRNILIVKATLENKGKVLTISNNADLENLKAQFTHA